MRKVMAIRIEQGEPFLQVAQSDTRSTLVTGALREVTVANGAADGITRLPDRDLDERGLAVADPMFEGIFH